MTRTGTRTSTCCGLINELILITGMSVSLIKAYCCFIIGYMFVGLCKTHYNDTSAYTGRNIFAQYK